MSAVRNTINLLNYYRRFLASDCRECVDPQDRYCGRLDKAQARRRLNFLLDVAINRKASIPDEPYRKCEQDHQVRLRRDQQSLRDIHARIRVYQFETVEVRRRFGHLLSSHRDD